MLYSRKTATIYSKSKQNLSSQLWEKARNELSGERGRESHSGPFPDFLGTTGFTVTLQAAFEYRAKTL